ncbi:MAG: hypothetical protein K5917_05450 [Clostridiales bacterium]|nr:hypothetical protein [Clostridiales bacterium]
MKAIKNGALAFVLCAAALCASCSNNIDTMIDDYNSQFTAVNKQLDEPAVAVGDKDFVASEMLQLYYHLNSSDYLTIVGPPGAVTYRWTVQYIMDKEDKEAAELAGEEVTYEENEVGSARILNLTINSSSQFVPYHSYMLRLYVTDAQKNEYSDLAYLTITYVSPY